MGRKQDGCQQQDLPYYTNTLGGTAMSDIKLTELAGTCGG